MLPVHLLPFWPKSSVVSVSNLGDLLTSDVESAGTSWVTGVGLQLVRTSWWYSCYR